MNRLPHLEDTAGFVLLLQPGLFDEFHEGQRAAVGDGRLVGVHLDDGIVHAHAGERRDDVLDCVDVHAAFRQRGGALDLLHFFHGGGNERLVVEINAPELEAVVRGRGLQGQGHLFTGVQGGALEGGGFG